MKDVKRKMSLLLVALLILGNLGLSITTTYGAEGNATGITVIELTKKPTLKSNNYKTTQTFIELVFDTTDVDPTYVDKMVKVATPSEAAYTLAKGSGTTTTPVEDFTYKIATSSDDIPSDDIPSDASPSDATPSDAVTITIDNTRLTLKSGTYTLTADVIGYQTLTYTFYISSSGSGGSSSGSSGSSSGSSLNKVGWKHDSTGWWYTLSNGTYPINSWLEINGYWYYFGNVGYMVTGWMQYDNYWFFLYDSGDMAKNWIQYNNQWYFFYDSGNMVTGWSLYNDQWYFFYDSGNMATSTVIDGYRINENGIWVQ